MKTDLLVVIVCSFILGMGVFKLTHSQRVIVVAGPMCVPIK